MIAGEGGLNRGLVCVGPFGKCVRDMVAIGIPF